MTSVSGLRKAMQGGLLSLAMVLLAGAVHAAPDPVLVLGRISDDPQAHYEQLQPLLDYVVARMHDVGIQEGRVLMARDPQQMASYLRRGRVTGSRKPPVRRWHWASAVVRGRCC